MAHSFFAGMGGFVVNTHDPHAPPYIPDSPMLILSAHAMLKLAEHGYLPDIPEASIADRSKADPVAKALAILQASWLLVQCIARWSAHLPVSLLELNTLAHVCCALLIYLLWWRKPYDVHVSITLSGDWVRPMCATLWMFGHSPTKVQPGRHRSILSSLPEIDGLVHVGPKDPLLTLHSPKPADQAANVEIAMNPSNDDRDLSSGYSNDGDMERGLGDPEGDIGHPVSESTSQSLNGDGFGPLVDLLTGKPSEFRGIFEAPHICDNQVCLDTGFGPKRESLRYRFTDMPTRKHVRRWRKPLVQIELTETRLARWSLVALFLKQHEKIWVGFRQSYPRVPRAATGSSVYEYHVNVDFFDFNPANWPSEVFLGREKKKLRTLLLSLVTAAYGCIHASAWNEYFPSTPERNLWRISSVVIAFSGVVISLRGSKIDLRVRWLPKPWSTLSWIGLNIFELIYVLLRSYLVIEALVSLRRLPVGAYETPRFVQYIPHL